jgi:tetratricopeptide (TPR) repeat protein
VAANAHRFAEARRCLERITNCAEVSVTANRLSLNIDQACGSQLESLLDARQKMAEESGRLEDLAPLGALYADLGEFNEADRIYQRALREYQDTSPFAVAWVCFQLGVLWGELLPECRLIQAAHWYEKAIQYLPGYVKARVHMAEIYLHWDLAGEAKALLIPAVASGDPEVSWRLGDALIAMEKFAEAEEQMQAARSGFETLLGKHLLAFADHGAEFYAGSGNNPQRAFELASINLANRQTLRAFEQTYETAVAARLWEQAATVLAAARSDWGTANAFRFSPLAEADENEAGLGGAIS